MKFSENVKEYHIDLTSPPEERWVEVISKEGRAFSSAYKQAELSFSEYQAVFDSIPFVILKGVYSNLMGEDLYREVISIEEQTDTDMLGAVNLSYDLGAFSDVCLGCTTGIIEKDEPIQVRTLDWPLTKMGMATRVFHFHEEARSFVVVGAVGFVGALSGMVPGGYSVCINWLPTSGSANTAFAMLKGYSPPMLLRKVLETADTYEEAVDMLKNIRLSCSVSFSVCGVKKGQACVIERTNNDSVVRKKDTVAANHFVSKSFKKNNSILLEEDEDTMSLMECSTTRREALNKAVRRLPKKADISDAIGCLDAVQKEDTVQKIAFCPATSEYIILRRVG